MVEAVDLPDFWLPLTISQAQHVVRQALRGGVAPGCCGYPRAVRLTGPAGTLRTTAGRALPGPTLSRSTICSLLALTVFDDCQEHGVRAVASELGMTVTPTLRYLTTWVAIGVLEQASKTRRYRLAIRWRHNALTSRPRPALPAAP